MSKRATKSAVPPRFKKLAREAFRRHAWNIGVSQFEGELLYMKDDKKVDTGVVFADMNADRRYLRARLRIYPHAIVDWKQNGDQSLEAVIAHETAHIATQHFIDCATARYLDEGEMTDAWEACTQTIARLSLRVAELEKKNA